MNKKIMVFQLVSWLLVMAVSVISFNLLVNYFYIPKIPVSSAEVFDYLESGKAENVFFQVETQTISWQEKSSKSKSGLVLRYSRLAGQSQWDDVYNLVKKNKIPFDTKEPPKDLGSIINLLFLGFFVFMVFKVMGVNGQKGGGAFSFLRSRAKRHVPEKTKVL